VLTADQRRVEQVLLEIRLAEGVPTTLLTPTERDRAADPISRGLLTGIDGRLRLTLEGRLLADAVVRDLLD